MWYLSTCNMENTVPKAVYIYSNMQSDILRYAILYYTFLFSTLLYSPIRFDKVR